MSVELLRQAAALMRERAEAATAGPWETYMTIHAEAWVCEVGRGGFGAVSLPATGRPDYGKANAEHIASWHPTVALAVADLLDKVCDSFCVFGDKPGPDDPIWARPTASLALTLANAYLGRTKAGDPDA